MDRYENEIIILRLMLDGRTTNAQTILRSLPRKQLQKLAETLDYFAAVVDDELIRADKR